LATTHPEGKPASVSGTPQIAHSGQEQEIKDLEVQAKQVEQAIKALG
jgi:hypothetical protein